MSATFFIRRREQAAKARKAAEAKQVNPEAAKAPEVTPEQPKQPDAPAAEAKAPEKKGFFGMKK